MLFLLRYWPIFVEKRRSGKNEMCVLKSRKNLNECPVEILCQCCSKGTQSVLFRPAEVQLRSSVLSEEDWNVAMKYILIQHFPPFFFLTGDVKYRLRWQNLIDPFSKHAKKTCKPLFSPLWLEKHFETCHRKSLVMMPFMFYRHYIFIAADLCPLSEIWLSREVKLTLLNLQNKDFG